MFLVYLSIPLMIVAVAVAVATVPLIVAMRREALAQQRMARPAGVYHPSFEDVPEAA